MFTSIIREIRAAFSPPNPKRFAHLSVYPTNWNGENEGKTETRGGPILVNQTTKTFEFGQYANIEIPPYLTALDIKELRARDLNPDNPAYTKCKEYFSKNPYCTKKELAAESKGEYHDGISINTAEKVLAAFRMYLEAKPTF